MKTIVKIVKRSLGVRYLVTPELPEFVSSFCMESKSANSLYAETSCEDYG